MSKGRCKSRADWRIQLGKSAERLSPHYRLDCDHGTAIVVCFETGGTEPIYLCEAHAKDHLRAGETRPESRATMASSPATGASPAAAQPLPPTLNEELRAGTAPCVSQGADFFIRQATRPTPEHAASAAQPTPPPTPNEALSELPASREAKPEVKPAAKSEARPARLPQDSAVRPPARDLTFGNPAKAMVDEAIWNLAPDGQLLAVHRRISDYSLKLDALLSASGKAVSVREAIDKPLEQSMLEIIENAATNEAEKDALIQQLGALQEWAKQGQQTALPAQDASRVLLSLGERVNWGTGTAAANQLKPAYRELYTTLKAALQAAVPEAKEVHDRLLNLHAAKSDLVAATPDPTPESVPR